jgi:coenzyme F420-reducing hydrogenase alpha subunit
MQNIEQQLHTLLREIDPKNAFSKEEQNKIIAHAASMFKTAHRNLRIAKKLDEKTIQARMNDVILKAMASLNEWDNYSEDYIDVKGLSSGQALRKVAENAKSKWGMQEVLNPDVLDYLDFDPEKDEPDSEQKIENGEQTSEALITPGAGKHRSDFISAPIR